MQLRKVFGKEREKCVKSAGVRAMS